MSGNALNRKFSIRQLFGDRKFYKALLIIVLPMILQQGITNFVNLLDNVMVGRVGTEQMSGVAIVNQLMFIYQIGCFGAVSGAGIYGAQFFGKGDFDGLRSTFRFKVLVVLGFCVICLIGFTTMGRSLIGLYLHEGTDGDLAMTLEYGWKYLLCILPGMLPFGLVQCYSGTLRETGKTFYPMIAGICAVLVNLLFNWLLIFGNLGCPQLGVQGAAIATTISRYVELAIVAIWTHTHSDENKFIVGAWRTLKVPTGLAKDIIKRGLPLLANEILWSTGMALLNQCYSTRGLSAVAAVNISSTLSNLFNVIFMSLGGAAAVVVGQHLGAGRIEKAKADSWRLITCSVLSCLVLGGILVAAAPLFPRVYNTTDEVRMLAAALLRVSGCCMPFYAFCHCSYFILRAGGDTMIVLLFDSAFMWIVSIPLAFCLSRFTGLPMAIMFLLCQIPDFLKCILGFLLLIRGKWARNLVE